MMAEVSIPHPASTSPPPNCAICLGTCTNKCFSDSCMHQFCFTCLLEWSKVKAECPLCKQPFTSIIHNVKSNNEYDEHIVEPSMHTRDDMLNEEYLYLPTTAQPSRHFQFRTTFTVDPRGELAIQQMLLTHRLTNSAYSPTYNYSYRHRHRRDISSTNFRRMVYARNIWVTAPPDITGRYRDISPHFYRENPAAINRLVPWLNRELNALLEENTQQVMILVDVILSHLNRHHIRGFFFKNLLREYLGTRTEHFIHEFYNFMKSPYDMVGYDRHAFYYPRNSFVHTIPSEDTSSSSDSDITVVATTSAPNPNPFHRPMLEVIEINSDSSRDSDVIIHEPSPPVVVDLINTSDEDVEEEELAPTAQAHQNHQPRAGVETKYESTTSESDHKPKYNPVAAKKEKRNKDKYEKSRKKRKSKISRHIYTSTESENNLSSDSSNYKHYKKRRKQKVRKSNKSKHVAYNESTDDEPLSEKLKKMKESSSRKSKRKDKTRKYYKHKPRFSNSSEEDGQDNKVRNQSTSNYHHYNNHHNQQQPTSTQSSYKLNNYYATVKTDVPSSSSDVSNYRGHYQDKKEAEGEDDRNNDSDKPLDFSMAAFAGPSYRSTNSPKIKKERCHLWYSRPRVFESEDDGTSDSDN